MISQKKIKEIQKRMMELFIYEKDLLEKYIVGRGKGGQKAQKSCNAVFIKHIPTKCAVSCCASRAREENRFLARRILCEKVALKLGLTTTTIKKNIAIRKQKKRRTSRNQNKLL